MNASEWQRRYDAATTKVHLHVEPDVTDDSVVSVWSSTFKTVTDDDDLQFLTAQFRHLQGNDVLGTDTEGAQEAMSHLRIGRYFPPPPPDDDIDGLFLVLDEDWEYPFAAYCWCWFCGPCQSFEFIEPGQTFTEAVREHHT